MKPTLLLFSLFPFTLLYTVTCCPQQLMQSDSNKLWSPPSDIVPFTQSSSPITVPRGKSFILELDSNASTGYSWQIASSDQSLQRNDGALKINYCIYKSAAKLGQKAMPGAPGKEFWSITVSENAPLISLQLPLKQARVWEKPTFQSEEASTSEGVFDLEVQVADTDISSETTSSSDSSQAEDEEEEEETLDDTDIDIEHINDVPSDEFAEFDSAELSEDVDDVSPIESEGVEVLDEEEIPSSEM